MSIHTLEVSVAVWSHPETGGTCKLGVRFVSWVCYTLQCGALGLVAPKLLPLWVWEVREEQLQRDRELCVGDRQTGPVTWRDLRGGNHSALLFCSPVGPLHWANAIRGQRVRKPVVKCVSILEQNQSGKTKGLVESLILGDTSDAFYECQLPVAWPLPP